MCYLIRSQFLALINKCEIIHSVCKKCISHARLSCLSCSCIKTQFVLTFGCNLCSLSFNVTFLSITDFSQSHLDCDLLIEVTAVKLGYNANFTTLCHQTYCLCSPAALIICVLVSPVTYGRQYRFYFASLLQCK